MSQTPPSSDPTIPNTDPNNSSSTFDPNASQTQDPDPDQTQEDMTQDPEQQPEADISITEPSQNPQASASPPPADIDMDHTRPQQSTSQAMQDTSNQAQDAAQEPAPVSAAALQEPSEARIAQKRELTLREFLGKMDDYAPIIPDALTTHYLTLAGLPPPPQTPLPLARLLALATQKFIADIAADSYQYARIRSGHSAAGGGGGGGGGGVAATGPGNPAGAANTAGGAGAATAAGGGSKQPQIGTARAGFGGGGGGGQGGGVGQGGGGQGAGAAGGRTVLTMEDLGMAVGEYGVNVKRGEFYR